MDVSSTLSSTTANLQQSIQITEGSTQEDSEELIGKTARIWKRNARIQLFWQILICLPFLPLTFLLILFFLDLYVDNRKSIDTITESGVRYIIRLDGAQWSRFVQHTYAPIPRIIRRASQKQLTRDYGHVFFSPEGVFLDIMLYIRYKYFVIIRTDVIRAPNNIDMMLRICFCKRVYFISIYAYMDAKRDLQEYDIFLAPDMSSEQISSLTNFLMHESTCKHD